MSEFEPDAAAPRPADAFLPETTWAVRAYYRFWGALPYIEEGMIAAGVLSIPVLWFVTDYIACGHVDPDRIAEVRNRLPALAHRKL